MSTIEKEKLFFQFLKNALFENEKVGK